MLISKTILRPHRELVAGHWDCSDRRKAGGRPSVTAEIVELVLRLARENPTWGYGQLQGAVANLGHRISDTTGYDGVPGLQADRHTILSEGPRFDEEGIMKSQASRRDFLGISLGLAGSALFPGCARRPVRGVKARLSLSVRVAEAFGSKDKTTMSLDQLIGLAKENGYEAICMRASQAGIHTPLDAVKEMRRRLDAADLPVSMVTGDFAIPSNNDRGPDALRNIAPYLDLAVALGTDLIRICMKKDEDVPWAQKASDEARERNLRLAHQSHCASMFETVESSLHTLRAVARPNFGIIYEPANLMIAGQDHGRRPILQLAPHIFNVYIQNHRVNPEGKASVSTWSRGEVRLDHIGLWEKGGVDLDEFFAGLDEIGYEGCITVHQAFAGLMPVEEAVRKSYRSLEPYIQGRVARPDSASRS